MTQHVATRVAAELDNLIDDVMSPDPRTARIALRRLTDDELPWIERRKRYDADDEPMAW